MSRLDYTLTRADARALLRLRRDWSVWAKALFVAYFILGGAATAFLPDWVQGAPGTWQTKLVFLTAILAQFALFLGIRGLIRATKAARMVQHPIPAVFEEWVDCIAGTTLPQGDDEYLSPELIGQVLETPSHIFIFSHAAPIIVPARAFPDVDEMKATAAHLRDLAAGPYYFEAPLDDADLSP